MASPFSPPRRLPSSKPRPSKASTTKSSQIQTSAQLDSHIQALPQELQDATISLTDIFHVDTTASVHIDTSYKPPVALQLNRKLRTTYAARYYSTTTFVSNCRLPTSTGVLHKQQLENAIREISTWLSSLSEAHQRMMRHMCIKRPVFLNTHPGKLLSWDLWRKIWPQHHTGCFEQFEITYDGVSEEGEIMQSMTVNATMARNVMAFWPERRE